jgi:hypothetical protein
MAPGFVQRLEDEPGRETEPPRRELCGDLVGQVAERAELGPAISRRGDPVQHLGPRRIVLRVGEVDPERHRPGAQLDGLKHRAPPSAA